MAPPFCFTVARMGRMPANGDGTGRGGGDMRRWIRRIFLVLFVVVAIWAVFRQGLLPARWTPLPPLNLASSPMPVIVDWQLKELGSERGLCKRALGARDIIKARSIGDRPFSKGCGWRNAIRIREAGGAKIGVARVTCEVGAALALWVKYDVQPLAKKMLGQRVAAVENFGTYSCRNIIGSVWWRRRRSEHASANAIDISGFRLENGQRISLIKHWKGKSKEALFLRAVHARACRYFRVALSPDFNVAHRDHFHFDRGDLWTCQ